MGSHQDSLRSGRLVAYAKYRRKWNSTPLAESFRFETSTPNMLHPDVPVATQRAARRAASWHRGSTTGAGAVLARDAHRVALPSRPVVRWVLLWSRVFPRGGGWGAGKSFRHGGVDVRGSIMLRNMCSFMDFMCSFLFFSMSLGVGSPVSRGVKTPHEVPIIG